LDLSGRKRRGCNRLGEEKIALDVSDCGVVELVWRESCGQEYLEIIFGEGWSRVGVVDGIPTQGEDAQGVADLSAAKGGRFGISEGAKFAGASFDDMARQLAGERGGFGAGTLRVGENVEVSEGAGSDEIQSCGVVGIGFAWETCNNVGSDGGVRQSIVDEFDAAGVVLGAIPAMHGGENAV